MPRPADVSTALTHRHFALQVSTEKLDRLMSLRLACHWRQLFNSCVVEHKGTNKLLGLLRSAAVGSRSLNGFVNAVAQDIAAVLCLHQEIAVLEARRHLVRVVHRCACLSLLFDVFEGHDGAIDGANEVYVILDLPKSCSADRCWLCQHHITDCVS